MSNVLKTITLIFLLSGVSFVISAQEQPVNLDSQMEQIGVTDQMLNRFVDSIIGMNAIAEKFNDRLATVENEDDMIEHQKAAQKEMLQIIKDNDLTVEQYQEISRIVQENLDLRQRVDRIYNDKMEADNL